MRGANAKVGEVWLVDLGIAGKLRPAVILTGQPADDELALLTIVAHTTTLRGNRWELRIPKPFLNAEGAFHLQQVHSVPIAWLERRLGTLTPAELDAVLDRLAERLGV